jgi:hypothetical protein
LLLPVLYKFFAIKLILALLLIAFCSACSSKGRENEEEEKTESPAEQGENLLSFVSVQVPGWEEEDGEIITKEDDLKEYMGNMAPLYLSYDLQKLAFKSYKNSNSYPLYAEIYEFASSEDAYGMYSFDTVGDKLNMGQEASYNHGFLKFWKGKMLVRIIAEKEHEILKADILKFGRQIDYNIMESGPKPHIISLIPTENLVPDSLHFFHENICLNNIYYIPESTTLYFSKKTDAVTAEYAVEGSLPSWRLILIHYPDSTTAKNAFNEFTALYFQGESVSSDQRINIILMGDGEYSSIALSKNFMILIFESPNSSVCRKMVADILANIELSSYYN